MFFSSSRNGFVCDRWMQRGARSFFCAEYGAGSVFALRDYAVTRCTAESHAMRHRSLNNFHKKWDNNYLADFTGARRNKSRRAAALSAARTSSMNSFFISSLPMCDMCWR